MSYKHLLAFAVMVAAGCNAEFDRKPQGNQDMGGGGGGDDFGNNPQTDADVCKAESVTAMPASLPVDIIWVIDNSGSMGEEESYVQTNINTFSSSIAASGIDYHVIMITDPTHINVPAPLGGSPRFKSVNQYIDSHDAFQQVIATYPQWQSFLRPAAVKHFVFVTDDESNMNAATFKTQLMALTNPGFPNGFTLHAIVAESQGFTIAIPPVTDHCFMKAAAVGKQYIDLQKSTMGVFASLCDTNWAPVFTALAMAVKKNLQLPCIFDIPPPPMGQMLDLTAVNLLYTPSGGTGSYVPNVPNLAGCPPGGGWYYDDPNNPMRLIACPSTCATLTADTTGTVSVAFGCKTIIP